MKREAKQELKDMVAIVTGGGKGIGRSITLAFAADGVNLVICGRTLPLLEQVSQEARVMGASILPVATDVTIESEVENMVEQALREFGKIDILVNNAGMLGAKGLIIDVKKEEWDEVINTNLTGMFLCSKAVLKHMIKRGRGNIINISSGAGRRKTNPSLPHNVTSLVYNVSKFAVEGMTYNLAKQVKPYGICVNAMRPGYMATDLIKDVTLQDGIKAGHPDELGELALFLALQTVESMTGESVDLAEWKRSLEVTRHPHAGST
ncbi:SDR family NAD(P)-dependent oxidoreductase [Chloroflexota bacterium]